jgi:hypothetical protein
MRFFGVRIKNPWVNGWNCSEFVMEMIKDHFPNEFKDIDPDTVTPKEIYAIMEEIERRGLK